VIAKAQKVGYTETLLGRRRTLPLIKCAPPAGTGCAAGASGAVAEGGTRSSKNTSQRFGANRAAINTPIQVGPRPREIRPGAAAARGRRAWPHRDRRAHAPARAARWSGAAAAAGAQGGAADIVVMAMIRVARSELLRELGWHMVLQVRRRTPACRCGGALGCVVVRAHERAWERESLPAAAGPGPHQPRGGRADGRATGQVHDELILEGPADSADKAFQEVSPPPPPPRTKWTRRVPHPVLIGHAASLPGEVVHGAPARAPAVGRAAG
jgi:hypothetical protein